MQIENFVWMNPNVFVSCLQNLNNIPAQVTSPSSVSPAPTMEVSVLQANLSRIISENSSMKETLVAKSHKIEELNARIGEILVENQTFVEQSHKQLIARNSR